MSGSVSGSLLSLQMEDGHSLFDYSVGLNDIVQLLVRQSPAVLPAASKDKDPELSDSDSGCGSGPSESDKSSHNGEAALELEGQPGTAAQPDWTDPCFGLYKVGARTLGALGLRPATGIVLCAGELLKIFRTPIVWAVPFFLSNTPTTKTEIPTNPQTNSMQNAVGQKTEFFHFVL